MSREADERAILEVLEKYKETIHTQNEDDFRKIWSQNRECTLISIRRAFHGPVSYTHLTLPTIA